MPQTNECATLDLEYNHLYASEGLGFFCLHLKRLLDVNPQTNLPLATKTKLIYIPQTASAFDPA